MSTINQHQIIQETRSTRFKSIYSAVKYDIMDEYDSDFVEECSNDSSMTLSSSETIDDAMSSSSLSSSWLYRDGPLYELSELMAELPIKKGLSRYYHGKSESFGSLANFKNIDDIAKKRSQRSRKSKCKSRSQSQRLSAKGIIVKNKKSCASSVARSCLLSSLET